MDTHSDEHLRLIGRLNALENLLVQLVMDRAAVSPQPHEWIKAYVAQMRIRKREEVVPDVSSDLAQRLVAATNHAVQEVVDVIERQGEIFNPASTRQ